MAEQIIQTLGFDAGQAISNIGRLNGALAGMTNNLLAASNAAKTFNGQNVSKSLGKITAGAKGAEAALGRVAKKTGGINNVAKSLNNAGKSSARLVLSFQTLSRIALAQFAVRGINLIQNELREAVTTAVDFNLALSEAAAISPRGVTNFGNEVNRLKTELIETSNSFGFDVLDLAEAKYQEFSNQVRGSADSNKLFIESNRLARISASSVGEAVGALSSVLNSYDQGVESADKVSAALFKTIELGRVRLRDIADQLGNVTPLARAAGIDFVELGAAIATITRSGVSASRSLTQIRALINQLQKPPRELARLFKEVFQVQDIEGAIQKFGGLQGVIEAVADEAGGSTAKIARFFTNIRARNAFISLTSQSEIFAESIEEIGAASDNAQTFLGDLLAEFNEQDAVKFQQAVKKLKNSFLELAQDALPAITSGLGVLNSAIENLGTTATAVAGGSLLTYGLRLGGLTTITKGFTAATLGAKIGIVGIGLGLGIALGFLLEFLDERAALKGFADRMAEIDAIELKNLKQIALDAADASKEVAKLGKESLKTLLTLEAAARKAQEPIRRANDQFVANLDSSLKDLVSSREQFVRAIENQIGGLEDRISKRTEDAAGIREDIADNEFDRRQRNFNKLQKAFSRQERAEKALRKAQATPATGTGLTERIKQLDRVKELTEESVAAAAASGSRTQLFNAEKLLDKVLKQQLATKLAQNVVDTAAAEVAKTKLAGERKNLNDLKSAVKDFQDNLSIFTEGGAILSPEDRDAAIANAKDAFARIQELRFDQEDLDFGDIIGGVDQQLKFNEIFNKLKPQFVGVQESLISALEAVSDKFTLKIPIELIVAGVADLGIEAEIDAANKLASVRDLQTQVTAKRQQLVEKKEGEVAEGQEKIARALERVNEVITQIRKQNLVDVFDFGTFSFTEQTVPGFDALETRLKELSAQPFITDKNLAEADTIIDKALKLGQEAISLTPNVVQAGERKLKNLFDSRVQELRELQSESLKLGGTDARVQAIDAVDRKIKEGIQTQKQLTTGQNESADAVKKIQDAMNFLNGSIGTSASLTEGIKSGYEAATKAADTTLKKQLEINRAQAAGNAAPRMFGGPMFRRHGGPLYRAFGGFTSRGTDTIPAMLSSGETVVNARSSRKFASQINSMNAGVTPVYRQEGGVVNNSVNIGDINVNGTSDPDTTARRVMSQIRREQRRGTSSSFK